MDLIMREPIVKDRIIRKLLSFHLSACASFPDHVRDVDARDISYSYPRDHDHNENYQECPDPESKP